MQSLVVRTFVMSWLATILVSISFAFIYVTQDTDHYWEDWHALHTDAFPPRVEQAMAALEGDGPAALNELVRELAARALEIRVYAVTAGDLPRHELPIGAQDVGERAVALGTTVQRLGEDRSYFAVPIVHRFANTAVVGELRRPSMLFWYVDPDTLPVRLLVLLAVSALFCYCLLKPLSRRLNTIRSTSRQLAAGDFSVRIGPLLAEPEDEAAGLARDFDHMAERIRDLVLSQQRLRLDLLQDLRPPLDRLIAASELALVDGGKKYPGYLERITLEAKHLRELIDQASSLTRLDAEAVEHGGAPGILAGG